jgi:hypothetical protein
MNAPSPARHLRLLGASLCIALAGFGANAEAKRIYSYRDDSGVVHFSDRPPSDARAEVT